MPIADTSRRLHDADISVAHAVSIADIASARGFAFDRAGNHAGPCPRCGGTDRFSISIRKGAFLCRQCHPKGGGGAISLVMFLDDVGFRAAVEVLIGRRQAPVLHQTKPVPAARNSDEYDRRQHEKAAWLWSQRLPISGSIAEVYLREGRKITCPLPPTLAFLPPFKSEHHPALISAFGLCDEVEPGIITAPHDVTAVHLTLLRPDGSGKAEVKSDKLMIGSPGKPSDRARASKRSAWFGDRRRRRGRAHRPRSRRPRCLGRRISRTHARAGRSDPRLHRGAHHFHAWRQGGPARRTRTRCRPSQP